LSFELLILFFPSAQTLKVFLLLFFYTRRQVKPTWLACLKIPTCVLSMPNVSQSCQKISS